MKLTLYIITALVLSAFLAGSVNAGDFIVYPAQGQSQDQMEKDKFECYSWAKNQTGFDPMKTPTASKPPPPKEKVTGGAGRGAVGGGLLGAGIGAIAGGKKGAGRGALIGAGSGAVVGGMRRSDQKRREDQRRQQWEQEETQKYASGRNQYDRAYSACLEGRGYSVK